MIDKIIPRFLDKSSDYKLVRKTSLIDALNIYIDTETGDENSAGVIKPIKGTRGINLNENSSSFSEGSTYKVLGSTTDKNTGVIYFYVFSTSISEHSIWAYDSRGVLPSIGEDGSFNAPQAGTLIEIISAPEFNFPPSGFVKGDIVYTNSREFDKYDDLSSGAYPEKDAILYFTDNRNEPRKVNVYRALLSGIGVPLDAQDTEAFRQIRRDFISACPRVPLSPPLFEFLSDESIKVNNFATAPGFQFAYQNVYKDGSESAISPYSDIAFPPSIVDKGASKTDNSLADNKCVITIPPQNQEVQFVKILARYGNGSNFIEINELENPDDGQNIVFEFLNDSVASGVSPQTVDKTFDNVPQIAQSQAVTSNRIAYGNYVEGYDNVDCSGVNLEPVYLDRPPEILDFVLDIKESVELGQNLDINNASTYGGANNKMPGFSYKRNQFPDFVRAGTRIRVSFSLAPDKNFHIYNGGSIDIDDSLGNNVEDQTYHQSKHVGSNSFNLPGYNTGNDGPRIIDNSPAYFQEQGFDNEPGWVGERAAGGKFLADNRENYFGFNKGVGSRENNWNQTIDSGSILGAKGASPAYRVVYGTSAGNPLVIQGGNLPFFADFTFNQEISSGARQKIGEAFELILSGKNEDQINEEFGVPGLTTINDSKRFHDHEIDLGINEYEPITVGSPYSYLLCGSATINPIDYDNQEFQETLDSKPPSCAFIVNRATARFYLEPVNRNPPDIAFAYRNEGDAPAFRLCVAHVDVPDEDSVMTCVRDLDPRSPWFPINPSTITSAEFFSNFDSVLQNNLSISNRVFHPSQEDARLNFMGSFKTSYNLVTNGQQFIETTSVFGGNDLSGETYITAGGVSITLPPGSFGYLIDEPPTINEDGNSVFRTVMESCFGCLVVAQDETGNRNLLGTRVDIDSINENYGSFRYSLADGEGGPGGGSAGSGTAYDELGNDRYGTIAGQCFVDNLLVLSETSGSALQGAINHKPRSGYNTYAAGSNDGFTGTGLRFLRDSEIAADLNPNANFGDELEVDIEGAYAHTTTLCGPLYTGKIVMNNFKGNDEGIAQLVNVNPDGTKISVSRSDTTTLPLVWFSSWKLADNYEGSLLNEGTSDALDPLIKSQMSASYDGDTQTWYPHPIVLGTNDGGTGGFDGSGGLAPGQQIDLPFGDSYPFNSVDFELNHTHVELRDSNTLFNDDQSSGTLSFKSSASHEFGMVYYDERGRHGFVNPIGSVYVGGYSSQDRGDLNSQGAVQIRVSNITHQPPSWARNYKIVYSKNTSVDKFVQYSAGGALVKNSDSENADPNTIFVSLNYLQGHPISYSDSYGARGRDNTPVLYSFTPGDRLRVISYFLSQDGENISRRYPSNAEFEVVGLFSFDDNDNPFEVEQDGDGVVSEAAQGLFVAIKSNQDAQGFRYEDVRDGVHNWGDNCIFEIFSPRKSLESDERLYYEIGQTFPIIYAGDGEGGFDFYHQFSEVLMTQGDVFFRRHAVNLREFDTGSGFIDLLQDNTDDEEVFIPESNFKNYYLESEAATDLFESRAISIGRPNIVKKEASQSRREASIIHSDRDVVESRKLGYSSFNRTIPSDIEIDVKAGAVNYMTNHQDSIFFVQRNKCGHIPVDRNLISDLSGTSSLIASSKFLGTPRYYAGDAGCDDNPESVVDIDNIAYFAHKSLGKVFKVSGANGVNVISDRNMTSFFREVFDTAIAVFDKPRIVGGYDPIKKEYLLTVVANDPSLSTTPLEDIPGMDVFEPTVIEDSLVSDFGFSDDLDVDVAPDQALPSISIDWSVPSNLQGPEWNIRYGAGDVTAPLENNILNEFSYWKTRPDGSPINLSENLSLRVRVENPGLFNGPISISVEVPKEETMTASVLSSNDSLPNALVSQIVAQESLDEYGDEASVSEMLGENSRFPNTFKFKRIENVIGPSGDEVNFTFTGLDGGPLAVLDGNGGFAFSQAETVQAVLSATEYQNFSEGDLQGFMVSIDASTVDQEQLDIFNALPGFIIEIPITGFSFAQDIPLAATGSGTFTGTLFDDSLAFRTNWFVGNMNTMRFVRENSLLVKTDGALFSAGSSEDKVSQKQVPIKRTITWNASPQFQAVRDDISVGGVSVPFNACSPAYGLYPYVNQQGLLDENFDLQVWFDENFQSYLDTELGGGEGYDFSPVDFIAALSSIVLRHTTVAQGGEGDPLNCLIIPQDFEEDFVEEEEDEENGLDPVILEIEYEGDTYNFDICHPDYGFFLVEPEGAGFFHEWWFTVQTQWLVQYGALFADDVGLDVDIPTLLAIFNTAVYDLIYEDFDPITMSPTFDNNGQPIYANFSLSCELRS